MINRLFISVFVLLIIALSFFRESIFININAHMWYLFYENDKTHLSSYLKFLKSFSYKEIYWFKLGLTIFFSMIFLFFSCIIIFLIFKEKKLIRWTIFSYLTIILVAGMAYLTGTLFNSLEQGYLISRFFMGMVQSPFLLIFLIPAFNLAVNSAEEKTK